MYNKEEFNSIKKNLPWPHKKIEKTMIKKDYAEANRHWLAEKAKEEGVKALPHGIYYKHLKDDQP
ncbi:FKBP-type peptidyl-prolyl cis-trans isomerase N-terminal domain-containing protein [Segatella oris]